MASASWSEAVGSTEMTPMKRGEKKHLPATVPGEHPDRPNRFVLGHMPASQVNALRLASKPLPQKVWTHQLLLFWDLG